jgi:hypothetical protein
MYHLHLQDRNLAEQETSVHQMTSHNSSFGFVAQQLMFNLEDEAYMLLRNAG